MVQRKSFPEISPSAWEHPADRAALSAFSAAPGASELVRRLVGSTLELSFRLASLASSARASESQFAFAHRLLVEACRVLDLSPLPELFIRFGVEPNAMTYGVDRPFIVLSSAALDFWDETELLSVIGHEVGHILSGHAAYKTLVDIILKAASLLGGGGLAAVAFAAARTALLEWDRKSELSADRAGLLACQDPQAVYRALMKTAAGTRQSEMDLNEFFRQARDYDAASEGLSSLYKLLDVLGESHPFPAIRMTTLQEWERGGGYEAVLKGEYRRRSPGDESGKNAFRDFETARDSYAHDFSESSDPLSQAAGKIVNALGGLFGGKASPGGADRNSGEGADKARSAGGVEELLDELFGGKR